MKILRFSIIILLLVSPVILLQCKDKPNEPVQETDIYGSWNWRWSQGGYSGGTIYADSVAYTRFLYIGRNMTYEEFFNDSLRYSGTFILEDSITTTNDTLRVIVVDEYPLVHGLFKITVQYVDQDSLILVDGCQDCYTNKYVRLGPI